MSDELKPGVMVRVGKRYGTLAVIEGDEQNPIGVVILDNGQRVDCKLESLELVKTSSDLRAELKRLRAENAELHKILIDALAILSTDGIFSVTEVIELLETAPEPSERNVISAIGSERNTVKLPLLR